MTAAWLAAALALPAAAAPAGRISESIIAVGIARRVPHVILTPQGDFSAVDQATGEILRLERGRAYKVEADSESRLILGPHLFLGSARILPGGGDAHVLIQGRKYRGNLLLKPNEDATLTVVDEMGLEEYLFGVLPREMGPAWPLEALKAQAVVARTFALNNLGKFLSEGYDLSGDAFSQVYSGLEVDSERVRDAVRQTRGEVLHYRGRLLAAYFHSTCGGRTADPAAVWGGGESPKPLRGLSERHCRISPHYRWTAFFPAADILRALAANGLPARSLQGIRPGDREGGRLRELLLKLDGRWTPVRTHDLRLWLGPQALKSARISGISRLRGGFEFSGSGYGHGVGLCQWGARAMALEGRDYRQILAHYFPGARVVEREE